jgi:hypothetical protein
MTVFSFSSIVLCLGVSEWLFRNVSSTAERSEPGSYVPSVERLIRMKDSVRHDGPNESKRLLKVEDDGRTRLLSCTEKVD